MKHSQSIFAGIVAVLALVTSVAAFVPPPIVPPVVGGGGTPGGSPGQLQINSSGSFGGLSGGAAAQAALAGLVGNPAFYAANYGAAANALTVNDVITTASSTTISSASHTFASADVGKVISIWAGTPVSTTGTVTSGSNQITAAGSLSGLTSGMAINAKYVPSGTFIVGELSGTVLVMSQNATATGSAEAISFVPPLNTTIASVSGGSAVLTTAPSSTWTGATSFPLAQDTFGSDDTAAYAAAISAASAAGGGTIIMPVGTSMITSTLTWPSKVSLLGQGALTSTLKWAYSGNMGASYPALINGIGSVTAPLTNITMANFGVDMDAATWSSNYFANCINLQYTVNWEVVNTFQHGSPASCDRNDFARGNIFANNMFSHTGRLATGLATGGNAIGATYYEGSSYPTSGVVIGNYIYDPGVTGILYQGQGSTNSSSDTVDIVGNHIFYDAFSISAVTGNNVYGIEESGGFHSLVEANVLVAPKISTAGSVGIGNAIGDNTGATPVPAIGGGIIGNNVTGFGIGIIEKDYGTNGYAIDNNIVSGTGSNACIYVSGTTTGTRKNIDISGNILSGCYDAGIGFNSSGETFSNFSIKNNKIWDAGAAASSGYLMSGLSFAFTSATAFNFDIEGNDIYDDGAATQKYALGFSTSSPITGVIFKHNNLYGSTVSPFLFGSGSTMTGVFGDNTGMPPPTISGCSATGAAGNGDVFSYVSGTSGACSVTVTPYGTTSIISNTGWAANDNDLTTPSDSQSQSGSTTTTFGVTGMTVTGDQIVGQYRSW